MRLVTQGVDNLQVRTLGCWFMGEGAYLMGAKKIYECTIFFGLKVWCTFITNP